MTPFPPGGCPCCVEPDPEPRFGTPRSPPWTPPFGLLRAYRHPCGATVEAEWVENGPHLALTVRWGPSMRRRLLRGSRGCVLGRPGIVENPWLPGLLRNATESMLAELAPGARR